MHIDPILSIGLAAAAVVSSLFCPLAGLALIAWARRSGVKSTLTLVPPPPDDREAKSKFRALDKGQRDAS